MYYNDFEDIKLSALGLGCMRFPVIDGDDSKPDEAAVQEMIDYAMANGINYYDTAWGYHGGNSEIVTGKALAKHDRDSFYLASKFPGYERANFDKKEEIFETQLKKCGVDHFDFYLCHTLSDDNIEWYLDDELGLVEYLAEQKKAGRIRHLGLSCHSSIGTLKRFVSKYREHLEFCQIQLNYLDYEFQNARDKVEYLNEAGLPVWVMEGLRGGKLAKSCLGAEEQLAKINADYTPANWGFAYLESVPGVTMILSGMSTVEQLQQNIEFFDSRKPLDDEAVEILYSAARRDAQRKGTVPCTACRYCTPNCPMNLPIPDLFAEFNEYIYKEKTVIPRKAMEEWPAEMWPTNCIGCGACAAVCPQQIDIPGTMSKFADMIEA